jgi:hypothetical protein
MQHDYWLKQTLETPLFTELDWARPENRAHAGKLLIVGGSAHGFAAPAEAYAESLRAGIGTARAVLPDAIQKLVGIIIEQTQFVPSTPSGSFAHKSLAELLSESMWADGILVAGDLGRNSETAILLEKFLQKTTAPITLTKDAVDYCVSAPHSVLNRQNTCLVLSLSQLQRLGTAAQFSQPIAFSMDLLRLVDWLHEFTEAHTMHLIVKHLDTIFVAVNGRVSTTKLTGPETKWRIWRLKTAAHTTVWWLQNPSKPLEAMTAAIRNL